MIFDYTGENNLFEVIIDNNSFISLEYIKGFVNIDNKITIKINKLFTSEKSDNIIPEHEVYDFFNNDYHHITLKELNRQGITIKTTHYNYCKCLSIEKDEFDDYIIIMKNIDVDERL